MWHARDNWLFVLIVAFPLILWLIYPSFHLYPNRNSDPLPVAPDSVDVKIDNGNIIVNWTEVAWWRSYKLYISENSDFSDARSLLDVRPPVKVDILEPGKVYYFAVSSVNWSGESDKSKITTLVLQNDEPSNFNVVASNSSNILSWNKVAGANNYILNWKVKNDPSSVFTPIMISGAMTSYVHSGLKNYQQYEYRLSAQKMEYITGISPKINAMPLAGPVDLAATEGDHEIQLNWKAAEKAISYSVYLSSSDEDFKLENAKRIITALQGNQLTIAGLENGQTYQYAVTANTPFGESKPSNVVSIHPRIGIPKNLSVMVADDRNYLLWDPVPGAKSYRVYWSSNGVVNDASQYFDVRANVPVVTHNDVKAETSYFYRIAALDKNTQSSLSTMAASIVSRVYPPPGEYHAGQQVFLTCKNRDDYECAVYFSTNAESYGAKISPYTAPLVLDETTTITYFAKDQAGNTGPEKTATYFINKNDNTIVTKPEPKPKKENKNFIRAKSA